ncbi:DoxX family protein [Nonomuraea sp. NPDC048901]|uniref:DoxX family protein n=1 Tax=Nonomuraea sp. NPDC048901 TaxID=3155627 RepID=UPI00341143F7
MTANLVRLGVGSAMTRTIGVLEIAGALGLVTGLLWRPIAVAAAAGLTLLLIGAIGYHARACDFAHRRHRSHAAAPVLLAILSRTATTMLLLTP